MVDYLPGLSGFKPQEPSIQLEIQRVCLKFPHTENEGAAGRAQQFGAPAALARDPDSVPSTHIRLLIADCNTALEKPLPLLASRGICTHAAYSHRYTHTTKCLKINPNLIFKLSQVMDLLISLSVVIILQSICIKSCVTSCILKRCHFFFLSKSGEGQKEDLIAES